ncbi:MAG TPA: hypothetical protein VH419_12735 [Nocardioidaceae bacterium]
MTDDTRPDRDDPVFEFGETLLRKQLDVASRGAMPDVDRIIRTSESEARKQRTRGRLMLVAGVAAASVLTIWGVSQVDLGSDRNGNGVQPATHGPTTDAGETVVDGTARALAAAVIDHLDGAQIESIEGLTVDSGPAQQLSVKIWLRYDGVPATVLVTAWQPDAEGYDPGAVSCSTMTPVDHSHDTIQDPPADIESFGCTPSESFPGQSPEWWLAADTVQPDPTADQVAKRITLWVQTDQADTDIDRLRPGLDQLREIALDDAVGAYTTQDKIDEGQTLPSYTDVTEFSD